MVEWKDLEIFLSKKTLYHVLRTIEGQPASLATISKTTGIRFEHVSKYMKELIGLGYVVNLTPGIKKGMIFSVTETGLTMLAEIKKRKLLENE